MENNGNEFGQEQEQNVQEQNIQEQNTQEQNIQELKEVRSKLGDRGAVRRTGELILNTARIGKE